MIEAPGVTSEKVRSDGLIDDSIEELSKQKYALYILQGVLWETSAIADDTYTTFAGAPGLYIRWNPTFKQLYYMSLEWESIQPA
jgi:hypothetical protein